MAVACTTMFIFTVWLLLRPAPCLGCDSAGAAACISGIDTSPDPRVLSKDALQSACSDLQQGIECMAPKVSGCSDAALTQSYNDASAAHAVSCNDGSYCLADFLECTQHFPNVASATVGNVNCSGEVFPMAQCVDRLHPACHIVEEIDQLYSQVKNLQFACSLESCGDLKDCFTALEDTGITTGTVTLDACTSFATYSRCLATAAPRCTGLKLSPSLPPTDQVADHVTDGCTKLATEPAIGVCSAFLTCVTSKLSTVVWYSPEVTCKLIQTIAGCAASSAGGCSGLINAALFTRTLNGYMVDVANQICGVAEVDMRACSSYGTCTSNLMSVSADADFSTVCGSVKDFMECADNSLNTCNIPLTTKPRLSTLVPMTGRLCAAVDGQPLESCPVFKTCSRLTRADLPTTDGPRLSSAHWCKAMLRVLQCFDTYGSSCDVTSQLKDTLTKLYDDFINVDCKNVYEFRTSGSGVGSWSAWMPLVVCSFWSILWP